MNSVNKTLYIPLYGKAFVSRKGIILRDPRAEEIWEKEGFPLKGKSASRWLAYYMAMRSAAFDRWVGEKLEGDPTAVVLHLGCGLDSRILRAGNGSHLWFDVDFPEVIAERRRYFAESQRYRMLGADLRSGWLKEVPGGTAIVVMEGVSMYLRPEELRQILSELCEHFGQVSLLMDCYTELAAKATKYKNPINDVGVTRVYGLDDPKMLENTGLTFVKEHSMTPPELIGELRGMEKAVFRRLCAGGVARKLYRMYEYKI